MSALLQAQAEILKSEAAESDEKTPIEKLGRTESRNETSSVIEQMYIHRKLSSRQIQLTSIGGAIGAVLFVGIGSFLRQGGPLSLLLGFLIWTSVIWAIAQCQIEMVTLLPLDGSFIRFAGRFVDEAWGVAAGYNYFVAQAGFVCFELTIFNTVIEYWVPDVKPAITISALLAAYFILNIWSVGFFGETEFWLSIGKLLLIFMLIFYTFITMVGGNPLHDAYGFRYWKDPGPMAEYIHTGAHGRFEGFIACLISAAFTISGPEYISMVAGEASNPRKTMPRAFKTILYRLVFFFCVGALCVGIVCPYNDPNLLGSLGNSAAKSPYTISMNRLGIPILPDIVNALIATSIVSAGDCYLFASSRSLYGLALAGQAPRFLTAVNRRGVPYLCVLVTCGIGCLSYLAVSNGTAKVLNWWISLLTASQMMGWLFMTTTWIRFNAAMKAQGLDRATFLPYRSRFQPFAAWYALIMSTVILIISGYTLFYPGQFDAQQFVFAYGMIFVVMAIVIFWKIVKRSKFLRAHEVDLQTDLAEIDEYTRDFQERERQKPPQTGFNRFLAKLW